MSRMPNDAARLYGVSAGEEPKRVRGPVGLTLSEMIYNMRGCSTRAVRSGVIPGARSTRCCHRDLHEPTRRTAAHGTAEPLDVPWASTPCARAAPCSAPAPIVMDNSVSMVDAASNLMRFYAPSREGSARPVQGTGWLTTCGRSAPGAARSRRTCWSTSTTTDGQPTARWPTERPCPCSPSAQVPRELVRPASRMGRRQAARRAVMRRGCREGRMIRWYSFFAGCQHRRAQRFGAYPRYEHPLGHVADGAHSLARGDIPDAHAQLLAAIQRSSNAGAVASLFGSCHPIGPNEEPPQGYRRAWCRACSRCA